METKEDLQAYIDRLSKEYDELLATHGHGVRPSYVSSELTSLLERIGRARKKLALLDIESPCDEWLGGHGKGQL